MVMIYTHAVCQGQRPGGSKVRVETDGRREGRADMSDRFTVIIAVGDNHGKAIAHCVPKSEPPKHFATATANLHRFK